MFAAANHINNFISKVVVFAIMVPLFLANVILKLISVIYAFMAPIGCLGFAIVGIVMWLRGSTEPFVWKMIVGAGIGYGFTFVLPHIPAVIDKALSRMYDFIKRPIIVRSPVKYTI